MNPQPPSRISTGVPGLDDIFGGGLPSGRLYLVEGDPGAGKTTFGLQFLLAGAGAGEPVVYVLLSETAEELRSVAASHGWDLENVTIIDLQELDGDADDSQYTFFHPAEVELSETTKTILDVVDRVRPRRVVFDSLSEMRLLARDPLRYRRQVLAIKQYFTRLGSTVMLLDYNAAGGGHDHQLESLCHGVLRLQQLAPKYGGQRRHLRVQKLRGSTFRDGYHDFMIRTGGAVVFPRLVANEHLTTFENETMPSGLPALDALLGGGLDRSTSTLLLGPAGVGKSTLGAAFVSAALDRGEKAAVFTFDETPNTFVVRGKSLGMPIQQHIADGSLMLRQLDPAEQSPGEFAAAVRRAVDDGARVIMIDSLNGYMSSMPEEHFLSAHLHELLAYLNHRGIITLMVVSQTGIMGTNIASPIELSYLADTVVLLRYFEAGGAVKKAVSVVKRRTGPHEDTIREFRVGAQGITVGRELREFQGVLSGNLLYTGSAGGLMKRDGSVDG